MSLFRKIYSINEIYEYIENKRRELGEEEFFKRVKMIPQSQSSHRDIDLSKYTSMHIAMDIITSMRRVIGKYKKSPWMFPSEEECFDYPHTFHEDRNAPNNAILKKIRELLETK